MAKTTWNQVAQAATARRNAAGNTQNTMVNNAAAAPTLLVAICNHAQVQAICPTDADNQATFAIAVINRAFGNDLIVCSKGASQNALAAVSAAQQALMPGCNVYVFTTSTTGLHAEMAIARYCMNDLAIAKNTLGGRLWVLCIGKPVCADCGGWMNQHGIGHCSLIPTGNGVGAISHNCGGPSNMQGGQWRNPGSLAVYIGGSNLYGYQSIRHTKSLNSTDH